MKAENIPRSRFGAVCRAVIVALAFLVALAFAAMERKDESPKWFFGLGLFAAALYALRLKRAWFGRSSAPQERVEVDLQSVRRLLGSAVRDAVAWSDLVKVTILTTDGGPFLEDFFWLLHASDGSGCVIAGEQAQAIGLLSWLEGLPGFNHEAVIQAAGCTSNAQFECWRGETGQGLAVRTRVEAARARR